MALVLPSTNDTIKFRHGSKSAQSQNQAKANTSQESRNSRLRNHSFARRNVNIQTHVSLKPWDYSRHGVKWSHLFSVYKLKELHRSAVLKYQCCGSTNKISKGSHHVYLHWITRGTVNYAAISNPHMITYQTRELQSKILKFSTASNLHQRVLWVPTSRP